MAKEVAIATPNFSFSFSFKKKLKKNYGQYEKFWIQLFKLKKFETLGSKLQKFELQCSN
jgi:hypothetical protein